MRNLRLIGATLIVVCPAVIGGSAEARLHAGDTLVAGGKAERGDARATLRGVVEGNGAPQGGYEVRLYASVPGKSRQSLLGSDTTDSTGRFEITYRRTSGKRHREPVLYALAERGSSMLAVAAGEVSRDSSVVVNERTTVAIGAAFAQFVGGRGISGNTYGMRNAVSMAANMADPETGLLGAVLDNPPNAGETSTRATFNTLANIVASCVADGADCETLFELATPQGGPPPATVLQAVANLTKYPSRNVGELFALADDGTYAPALAAAPTSWLLFIKFTGGFYSDYDFTNLMSGPGNVAFDERGFAWINDNYVPTPELRVGCAGLRLLKLDRKSVV